MTSSSQGRSLAYRYEAVFSVFLAVLAYLAKGNADLVYPQILYLFLLLLCLNFSAVLTLRLWPARAWVSALIILANCATITAILSYSGGAQSNLWVLYLLPIFTVALLLEGREVAWITAGAAAFNSVFYVVGPYAWTSGAMFEFCLKAGLLVFCAALTWRLANAERSSLRQLAAQRAELERLEDETRRTARRDERVEGLAQLGLVSAAIVHDLKNPLMTIQGSAELCLDWPSLEPGLRGDIERIQRAALRCHDLVRGILDAARNERRPRAWTGLESLVEASLEHCRGLLGDGRVEVRRPDREPSAEVEVNAEELERLLVNLIANAVKAMPEGGVLTLRARAAPSDGGSLRCELSVEDTGPGLPKELAGRLFEPFASTRVGQGGTGLGLYLSREIAVKHGGDLHAENAPDGGARFVLSLPCRLRPAAA